MLRPVLCLAALGALAMVASAQDHLIGPDQYPQYRGMSALPGSSYAQGKDGNPNPNGALSLSTPIGYALGKGHFIAGGSVISGNLQPKFGFGNIKDGNGTAQFMYGLDLKDAGSLTLSYMVLSSFGDNAVNFQYQPNISWGPVNASIGVQDVTGHGGSAGENIVGDGDSSRSFFVAGTAALANDTYFSAGWGTRRFQKGFANASTGVGKNLRLMVEHDGFNFNTGLAYTLPYEEDRKDRAATIFVGLVRGQYMTISLNLSY